MIEFESIESMAKRLNGTGGGAQADAVLKAIKLINGAPGMLDESNRAAAIYHLDVALSGKDNAESTIENTAQLISCDVDSAYR